MNKLSPFVYLICPSWFSHLYCINHKGREGTQRRPSKCRHLGESSRALLSRFNAAIMNDCAHEQEAFSAFDHGALCPA